MGAEQFIAARVSPEMKSRLRALAQQQEITESALLKRVLELTLNAAGPAASGQPADARRDARYARLYVRLTAVDQALLRDRARARCLAPATYASTLIRAHLRGLMPVPDEELRAIRRSSNELAAIGRNLNQVARATQTANASSGPSREELRTVIKICEMLRDSIRTYVVANRASWRSDDAAPHG